MGRRSRAGRVPAGTQRRPPAQAAPVPCECAPQTTQPPGRCTRHATAASLAGTGAGHRRRAPSRSAERRRPTRPPSRGAGLRPKTGPGQQVQNGTGHEGRVFPAGAEASDGPGLAKPGPCPTVASVRRRLSEPHRLAATAAPAPSPKGFPGVLVAATPRPQPNYPGRPTPRTASVWLRRRRRLDIRVDLATGTWLPLAWTGT